jgi:glycine betaine/proline transport system ATP-binding protein
MSSLLTRDEYQALAESLPLPDPDEAATLGDRIALLLKGEVVQEGHPLDIVLSPANDYVRNFVRGIDVFKVLSAGQITDPARPPIVLGGSAISSMALARPPSGPVAVTDGDGRLLGIIERPLGLGSSPAEWKKQLSQDFTKLAPDTLIGPFLDELSRNFWPVVVAREDGTFVGMVTGSSVLKALAGNSPAGKKARLESQQFRPEAMPVAKDEQRAG